MTSTSFRHHCLICHSASQVLTDDVVPLLIPMQSMALEKHSLPS